MLRPGVDGLLPRFSDHFRREGLVATLRRGHPYDALETYELLRALYEYEAAYVNYGYWPDGAATVEPGRRLAELAADALGLNPGARLVDAGAGLGQAAVDLVRRHQLAEVIGVNLNPRQVGFARALAKAGGCEDQVHHEVADACTFLRSLAAGRYDGVLAIECVGHFAEPERFLADARRALRAGGRIAFTLNVARRPPGPVERSLFRVSYGFVPLDGERWVERLESAGFTGVVRRDLTGATLEVLAETCLARLREPSSELRRIPWPARAWVGGLFRTVRRAVRSGTLGYELISATGTA